MDPTRIAGRYDVEGIAGSGGLGVVYRCRDRETNETVAVKVAPRTSIKHRERFMREAEMLSTIRHPSVVRYLGHGMLDTEQPWLAMEWLEGEDLHARLERTPLTLPESIALARQLAGALGAAHAAGIVHRDVKPANVFLVGRDATQPKLIDFGIARAAAQHLTLPGGLIGTPGYMAPEQARGEPLIDPRADVFSLGCVLFECLSGRRAFDGDSPMAVLAKVLLEEPPALRSLRHDVPPALAHAVARMLAKSKESRYASASEVGRDLERLETSTEERAPSQSNRPGALTTRERKLLCLLLARRGEAPVKDATLVDDPDEARGTSLRDLASSIGTNAEVLLDGSLVVVIEGTAAVDQVVRAARAALRLRAMAGANTRLAIATGRGEITGTMPFGEVVDRACALLDADGMDGSIRVDVLTSNLIEGRFKQTTDERGALLVEELESESMRSLLGRKTPCVGRDRELATLLALYGEVREENSPRFALVTGDAGMGKSRIKLEVQERVRGDDVVWLQGGGDVAQPGAPFGAIASALRRELGLRRDLAPEERRARVIERLKRSLDEANATRLAPFLAQLAGAPLDEGEGSRLEAVRADATAMGDALRAAFQDFVEAEGKTRPVVLVLEDMQWGDRPTITLALGAMRALKSTPLWILMTGRPEVLKVFRELTNVPDAHVSLGPLSARASMRLLEELLEGKDAATLERLAQQAGGNPFLIEELARAFAQGRTGPTETVLATAQARLEALSPSARRVLRAAAVLGEDLGYDGLAALLVDLDDKERAARVAELVQEEILEADASDHGRLRFRQVLLREAAYASLTAADEKLAHALAAKWLAVRGGGDPMTLATHFERSGNAAAAAQYYVDAAEMLLEGSDLDGALERIARAEAAGATGETLGRLLLLRADVSRWRGDHATMRDCANRATQLLPEGTSAWLVAKVNEAVAATTLGDTKPAEALATLSCLLLEGGDVSGPAVWVAGRTCNLLVQRHIAVPAAQRLVTAISTAMAKCKDPRAVGMVYAALSTEAANREELENAVDFGNASSAKFTSAGDVRNAVNTRVNTAYLLMMLGQWQRARAELEQGLVAAERAGLLSTVATVKHNLGLTLLRCGDAAAGEVVERDAIRAFEAQQDPRLTGASRFYLGLILIASGKGEEAEREMLQASKDVTNVPAMVPVISAGNVFALLARGKNADALARAREAYELASQRAFQVEDPRTVKLALAQALVANGQSGEAAGLLSSLAVELLEQASHLRDPELRRSFLHDVEEHARIFTLQKGLAQTE